MMAKIALAAFSHETNTFSPYPTTYADYCRRGGFSGLLKGEEILAFKETKANFGTAGFMVAAESWVTSCSPGMGMGPACQHGHRQCF